MPIVAVLDTHVQADHVSGMPELVARTGATAYLPEGAGVEFDHHALADGEVVKLGNTEIEAISTPGHALAHHAYLVTDHRRGEEPWLVLTGDALLVGDAGRPDLHAHGEHTVEQMARALYRSLTERLLTLPDHLVLYPSHYSGSVCGRGLSANPISTIGFERRHNAALQFDSEDAFVQALVHRHPAGARAAGRDRRREPLRPAARRGRVSAAAVRLGLRENAAQFSLLVLVNAFVGAMVGLERSTLPLDRTRELPSGLERGGAVVHRRVRLREGADEPRRRRARAPRRTPAAADRRVGRRAAGPAADRARAELGLDRRRQRAARDQPRTRVVHDRGDEDRPRRPPAAAAWRSGSTNPPATAASRSPPASAAGWPRRSPPATCSSSPAPSSP